MPPTGRNGFVTPPRPPLAHPSLQVDKFPLSPSANDASSRDQPNMAYYGEDNTWRGLSSEKAFRRSVNGQGTGVGKAFVEHIHWSGSKFHVRGVGSKSQEVDLDGNLVDLSVHSPMSVFFG